MISSLALRNTVGIADPHPRPEVLAAARGLRYRDFLTVAVVLNGDDIFPDNWIYIHVPEVKVGRIQNFRSWSPWMVPDPSKACVGLEYFCFQGDELWEMDDDKLVKLGMRELEKLGLARADQLEFGFVERVPKAYPMYDADYAERVHAIRSWLDGLDNFIQVGRNGLHRYNNSDHSMLTAMRAVDNLVKGTDHDIWAVNAESAYHEEGAAGRAAALHRGARDRGDEGAAPPASGRVPLSAFCLALGAAFLHASWNVLLAGARDSEAATAVATLGGVALLAPVALVTGDVSDAALPFAGASAVLHVGYLALLARAYQGGEVSVVYPVSRGTAPVLVLVVRRRRARRGRRRRQRWWAWSPSPPACSSWGLARTRAMRQKLDQPRAARPALRPRDRADDRRLHAGGRRGRRPCPGARLPVPAAGALGVVYAARARARAAAATQLRAELRPRAFLTGALIVGAYGSRARRAAARRRRAGRRGAGSRAS